MIWLVLACVGAEKDSGCATPLTWENYADGFFASYCRSCHSGTTADRHEAPVGVDFDHEADVDARSEAVRAAVITNSTMPPGGGVLPEDLLLLEEWLDCR